MLRPQPMDPIAVTAASGLRARMEALDILSNNLANSTTGGFKLDREFYSLYQGEQTQAAQRPAAHYAARDPERLDRLPAGAHHADR